MADSPTPLTDALLDEIAARLSRQRGAKAAAARHAGVSRQNLGRMLRERGIPRESEVLLKLDAFSKQLEEPKSPSQAPPTPDTPTPDSPPEPVWML